MNYRGHDPASSHVCSHILLESEILNVKLRNNLGFAEAEAHLTLGLILLH